MAISGREETYNKVPKKGEMWGLPKHGVDCGVSRLPPDARWRHGTRYPQAESSFRTEVRRNQAQPACYGSLIGAASSSRTAFNASWTFEEGAVVLV